MGFVKSIPTITLPQAQRNQKKIHAFHIPYLYCFNLCVCSLQTAPPPRTQSSLVGRPAVPRIISNHGHWKSSSCIGLWDPEVKAMVSPSGPLPAGDLQGVIVSEISHLAQNMGWFGFKSSKSCDICEPFWHVYIYIYTYRSFYFFYMFFNSKDYPRI